MFEEGKIAGTGSKGDWVMGMLLISMVWSREENGLEFVNRH